MNLKIKINIATLKEIAWPIVILYLLKLFNILSTKQAFILYIALLGFLIIYMKKIVIPNVGGMKLYVFFIIYSTIVGFTMYDTRKVIRDLYYVLPTVVLVVIGYYIYVFYGKKFSISKTIVIMGTINSTYTFLKMMQNVSIMSNSSDIRGNFDKNTYEVVMALLVLFAYTFTNKQNLFGKKFNYYSLFVMLGQLILSLTRSAWIEVAIGCIGILILDAFYNNQLQKLMKNTAKIVAVMLIGMSILISAAPSSVVDEFSKKFAKSAEELNSEQEFDSVDDTMENWRAYEIQSAKKQWSNSSPLVELFGAGMGKGVYLQYVPYTWEDMTENNEIPLLHCGYYTILPKGGLFGVFALIWFMLAGVVTGIRLLKKREDIQLELIILVVTSVVYMIHTYIVRGPVAQDVNITWSVLLGWINAKISRTSVKKINEKCTY